MQGWCLEGWGIFPCRAVPCPVFCCHYFCQPIQIIFIYNFFLKDLCLLFKCVWNLEKENELETRMVYNIILKNPKNNKLKDSSSLLNKIYSSYKKPLNFPIK